MCDLGAKHNGAEIDTGFYGGREIAFQILKLLLPTSTIQGHVINSF